MKSQIKTPLHPTAARPRPDRCAHLHPEPAYVVPVYFRNRTELTEFTRCRCGVIVGCRTLLA
jgi:hypothetical protein